MLDCLIIGAGPAGLTAAIYMARYRRDFAVIDAGASRAAWIPVSHNHAGFPEGIPGKDLLARMREQAERYGARIEAGEVTALNRLPQGGFAATVPGRGEPVECRFVILATGVIDVEPPLPNLEKAIERGLVRHCPVCDGYEVTDQKIGIIGRGASGMGEAMFLSTYSSEISLLTLGTPMDLSGEERARLDSRGIRVVETELTEIDIKAEGLARLRFADGAEESFDSLYSALGCKVRSDLAAGLGARTDDINAIEVGQDQQSSVPGLYVAGDVVSSLNQISVAMGQAAIAATRIHHALGI